MLLSAAAAAAGGQQYPAGTLYLVPTPIGNLADITLRALHVLSLVDAVACEDTRVSAALLRHFGLDKSLLSVHEHNEAEAARRVAERLARGERIAFVSDAGTPAISDPGARLVDAVRAAGHPVVPLPGASSVVTALSAAGDFQSHGFRFAGFLPTKAQERRGTLQALLAESCSLVLFEAPHRIVALAQLLAELAPKRPLTLCRELTKQFETVETLRAEDAPAWLAGDPHRVRGEFVLVLHAPAAPPPGDGDGLGVDSVKVLQALLAELPLRQAVGLATTLTGASRNLLYQRALELRDAADKS